MLILPKRKSTFSFYESFSDLVFCTLVMFLVLVLFLAMNVNQKQVAVEGEQQELSEIRAGTELDKRVAEEQRRLAELEKEQTAAELEEQRRLRAEAQGVFDREMARVEEQRQKLLDEARQEMLARRAALATMEREVDRQWRVYEQALGSNRFTGLPARPRLVVAYDWQPRRISVHPVPAWFVDELNTTPPGLTDAQLAAYYQNLRGRFIEITQDAEPLNARQYRALIRSIGVGLEPVPRVGDDRRVSLDLEFVVNEQGLATTQVGVAIPGGNGAYAGVRLGDTLIAIGDQPVTPENLQAVLARYQPGDSARLLVDRAGRPVTIDLTFRELRVVELVEAYRTDLSMVVSGAVDSDYTYLWEPTLADALRAKLQQGRAAEAVWQNESRWEGRVSTPGRPVLRFDAVPKKDEVRIGGETFSLAQFRRLLEALGGGGIVIEYEAKLGPEELPEKIYNEVLRPTGFVIRAPQLEKLLEQAQ